MSRVQLALNVADLDAAVEFYSKLFNAEPAKRRPGYANFAIADPPLKLVLIENAGAEKAWRVRSTTSASRSRPTEEVQAATGRLAGAGLDPDVQEYDRPAATRSRTKCGWTTRTVRRGRSTRCSPTLGRTALGSPTDGLCAPALLR